MPCARTNCQPCCPPRTAWHCLTSACIHVALPCLQLFLQIADQHLCLTGQPSAACASSWGREGDLAWALAGQLAPLALPSPQLGVAEASRVALGACSAIDAALKPVLQPDDSGSEASVQGSPAHGVAHSALPTPAFVAAAAALAAQTARGLAERHGGSDGEGGGPAGSAKDAAAATSAVAAVTDTLLGVCEDCTAAVAEIGVGDRASDALLNISLAVARQAAPLMALAGERDRNALQDLLPRLQALLVGWAAEVVWCTHTAPPACVLGHGASAAHRTLSQPLQFCPPVTLVPGLPLPQAGAARLTELEYLFPGGQVPTADSRAAGGACVPDGTGRCYAEAKVKALWVWDLSQDLAAATSDPALRTRRVQQGGGGGKSGRSAKCATQCGACVLSWWIHICEGRTLPCHVHHSAASASSLVGASSLLAASAHASCAPVQAGMEADTRAGRGHRYAAVCRLAAVSGRPDHHFCAPGWHCAGAGGEPAVQPA